MTRYKSTMKAFALAVAALMFCLDAEAKLSAIKPSASQGKYATYVLVSWPKHTGAKKGYRIYRGTSTTYSKATCLAKIPKTTTTSYKDTSAKSGKTYYYWVLPVDSNNVGWYSASKYAKGYLKKKQLVAPTPQTSISSTGQLTISWSKVTGAKGYVIRRGTSAKYAQSKELVWLKNVNTLSYVDKKATSGTKYYYWVCPMTSASKYVGASSKYATGYRKTRAEWMVIYRYWQSKISSAQKSVATRQESYNWALRRNSGVVSARLALLSAQQYLSSLKTIANQAYQNALRADR